MPSSLDSGPFLSLRADDTCGRTSAAPGLATPFSSLSLASSSAPASSFPSPAASYTNHQDEFLKLSQPQQDVLLLHGPRQRYSLEKAQSIPELQDDRELLVQVLAIGLNPVDWKGADYGFGQPSYPWINGRDFAGIVVRAPRASSRIKLGDIVAGPSTDYRDVRKAAYQEYVVTTDFNVARVPAATGVKTAAALGVAFVSAAIALGVSFGLDYTRLKDAPAGPDLHDLVRRVDPRTIKDDVRDEVFGGISLPERPVPGEWIAVWGASSTSALMALQIARKAGLKTIAIADVAKNGSRLIEVGADVLVDRLDTDRALSIVRSVTGGKLRFAFDTQGRDSATLLSQVLSADGSRRAHLLGLTGLPKEPKEGVVYHSVPIKLFHDSPQIGESIVTWLEQLLVSQKLELPEIEIADGGLAGINAALDKLRSGTVSAKRIVVPVNSQSSPSPSIPGALSPPAEHVDYVAYHDQINSDPDRLKFAYWVPNVSGGLVISKIPQHTRWDYKANVEYGQTAERWGFEYALSQIRFMAGYGADNQLESVSISQAILHQTKRLKVIAALLPGPWNPAVAAKQIASIDNYTDGRIAVNVVFGWFKLEFLSIGQWWLDHSERYRRGREFIECLRGIWTQDSFTYNGAFYNFKDYPLKPKPVHIGDRKHPEIFQGGNSQDARDTAAAASDYYFMNGNTLEGFTNQIADVKERAKAAGREGEVKFAVNGFVIVRDTEEEAIRVLSEIQGKADKEAVEGFRQQVQNAGASSKEGQGMWANSKFEDLVQYNDGFKTKLIGTVDQVVDRILLLKSMGVSILLTAFLHYDEEIELFGKKVLPRVRELERQGRGKDFEFEKARTGHIYAAKPAQTA